LENKRKQETVEDQGLSLANFKNDSNFRGFMGQFAENLTT
jgi:hypothetical protein